MTQPADDRYSSCRLGRYCVAGAITGRLVVWVAEAADTELVVRCHSGEIQPCSEALVGLEIGPYRRWLQCDSSAAVCQREKPGQKSRLAQDPPPGLAGWLAVCDKQLDQWGLQLSLTVCRVLVWPWDGEMAGQEGWEDGL